MNFLTHMHTTTSFVHQSTSGWFLWHLVLIVLAAVIFSAVFWGVYALFKKDETKECCKNKK